jgi:hypothetical protein
MKLMYSGSLLHILSYGYVVQPTPHQSLPSRRSSLLPADGEVEGEPEETTPSNVAED